MIKLLLALLSLYIMVDYLLVSSSTLCCEYEKVKHVIAIVVYGSMLAGDLDGSI